MKIEIIKCLQDNYSYLIIDETNKNACVVDPGESIPIKKSISLLIKSLIKGRQVLGFDVVEFSPIKNFFAYDFTVASLVYRIMELIDLND